VDYSPSPARGYVVAALLGAVGGGLIVALATRALPKIISQVMAEMMSNMPPMMMQRMKDAGCNPAEMCQQMCGSFAESPAPEELPAA
jgi:hypothetical protein